MLSSLHRAQRVQNFAYALLELGIQPGDRVAIISPNTPMIAVCELSAHSLASPLTFLCMEDAHQGILAARAVICPIKCVNISSIRLAKSFIPILAFGSPRMLSITSLSTAAQN